MWFGQNLMLQGIKLNLNIWDSNLEACDFMI